MKYAKWLLFGISAIVMGMLLLAHAGETQAGTGTGGPPIVQKSPDLANLWLCQPVEACTSAAAGIGERDFNISIDRPVTSISPKGEPQSVGSFEFEVRFDRKLLNVAVSPGALFLVGGTLRSDISCATNSGQGFVQYRCNITGKTGTPIVGPGVLAIVHVTPTADVYSMVIPSQENGIATQLINQECDLGDLQGHPIATSLCTDADVTIRYLEGDTNADCSVDVRDQQEMAFRWGSHTGQLLYNSRFDLEPAAPKLGDGDIDAKDIQVIYGRHGSTCDEPHPDQEPIDPKACTSAPSAVILSVGAPGANLLDPSTLLTAVRITNSGTQAAENVQLTSIALTGGTLTVPASLPFALGTIPGGGSFVLNADFSGSFAPLASYALVLQGTYQLGGVNYCFTLHITLRVPPAGPGSGTLVTNSVLPNVTTGGFPPHPPAFDEEDVNQPFWTVPTAPSEPGGAPPGQTSFGTPPGSSGSAAGGTAAGAAPAIVFDANDSMGLPSGGTNGTVSSIAEPSGASGGGVIFTTANWVAAYSTDGGASFTNLDPTTIFPNDAVGYCCDQVVQYIPSIDRFVWLLQGNGYRLAMASPAAIISSGGTAWTYWNLTPQVFGQPNGTGFDYPDMSLGNNSLYMSWDAGFGCPTGCRQGFQVVRTSLAGLQAAGTITVEFTDPPDAPMAWGSHLMQDTGDEIFWAGHNNNKNMRVFSLAEGSNTYFWRDKGISTWANNALSSNTPDSQNWLAGSGGFPGNAIIGGTRVGNQLWFGWDAGTDSNFPQAHIEMVVLDRGNNFNKIQQVQIWNENYAFAYPSMATNNCTGEVGLSFEFGGGGNYENHVVGFWGDFIAYITTASNVGTTRFGDYVTIRDAPITEGDPGNLFTAFGYGLNSVPLPGTGTTTDLHYVLFGRPPSSCSVIG